MAYHVVKTIKGRQYLYLQSTYREGGKVKTNSHYVGAVDSRTGELTEPSDNSQHIRPSEAHSKVAEVLGQSVEPETPVKPLPKPKPSPAVRPALNVKLGAGCSISQLTLQNEHKKRLRRLESYGVEAGKFPTVTVKHSTQYRHYKPAFSHQIVITAPRSKFNREKLRTEYRKALHLAFIETLEREAPERLYVFKYTFDKAFQQTEDALSKFLWNCNSKNAFYKVLALKFFNVMNPVPTGKRTKLAPEKIGLVEYGKRADWKQEYASIMTAIDKHGIEKLRNQAHAEVAKANVGQRKELERKTIFFIRKRKTVRRLQARIAANRALLDKLRLIQDFGF